MKNINIIILIIANIIFFSCNETEDLMNDNNEVDYIEKSNPTNEIPSQAVELFAKALSRSKGHNLLMDTENLSQDYTLEPIYYNNIVVLWVINYNPDGYILLSGNKEQYPIIERSNSNNFTYSKLSEDKKGYYDDLIIRTYNDITNNSISTRTTQSYEVQTFDIWDDIIEFLDEDCIDCEYEIEIEFADVETEEAMTRSPVGPGTITNRDFKKGYPTVYPQMAYPERKWTMGVPYNYNMRKEIYSGKQHSVSSAAVAFARLMDYYGKPNRMFWTRQPNEQTINVETELTRFLAELTYDLGAITTSHIYHPSSLLTTTIRDVLSKKYGFSYIQPVKYHVDQSGFDQIRLHVQNYGPVFYVPSTSLVVGSMVIDGAAELHTKVTTKKKVFGVTYKKKVKYYYCDYFHCIGCSFSIWRGWKLYDAYAEHSHSDHDIILIKP